MSQVPGLGLPTDTDNWVAVPVYQDKLASGMEQGPVATTLVRSLGLHASWNVANTALTQPPGQSYFTGSVVPDQRFYSFDERLSRKKRASRKCSELR
jgi:hypothetical protein